MFDRIPLAGLEALYEDLQLTGDWSADDGPAGDGRVLVHRVCCGVYVQEAEVLRTAAGSGWVIYASCECPMCGREVRVSRSVAGREIDLAAAVNAVALELGSPPFSDAQHHDACELGRLEAEMDW